MRRSTGSGSGQYQQFGVFPVAMTVVGVFAVRRGREDGGLSGTLVVVAGCFVLACIAYLGWHVIRKRR